MGVFFLRLSGQGLMSHTASSSDYLDILNQSRGKALSYIWFGMSLGEFCITYANCVSLDLLFIGEILWIQGFSITILLFLPAISYLPYNKRRLAYFIKRGRFRW